MKKVLLGTSALCACALATPGVAQTMNEPIKLGFGGYMNTAYGDILSESGANGRGRRRDDINEDAVLSVKGSTKLDNGFTVGARIDFRVENSFSGPSNAGDLTTTLQDVIKKQYLYVRSDFGEIRLGDDDDARRQKAMGAPLAGQGMFGANTPDLLVLAIPGGLTNTTMKSTSTGKRVERILYFTPTIAGFSFAASYAPGGEKAGIGEIPSGVATPTNGVNGINNDISVSGSYSGKFGDFSLDGYAGGSSGHRVRVAQTGQNITGRDNPLAVAGGGVVGWGPIKFGGAYEYLYDRDVPVAGGTHQTRKTWDIGPEYIMGPFSVSLDWTRGIYYNREVNTSPKLDMISLSGAYQLGPGISIEAALDWAHYDSHVTGTAVNGTNYSGLGLITGVSLNF